jgi:sterol desaturase/sphingolipid hydroxylase (fatty acid hydroxylase superfamily)
MSYPAWLFGLSLLFVLLERAWPRRPLPLSRRGIWSDLAYLVFNGEYLGVFVGVLLQQTLGRLDPWIALSVFSGTPFWLQLLVLLVGFDLLQWAIHNLLHRVPWLWEFHKVHHSIVDLDWVGNWRFHWFEAVVYRFLLYPFAALCGFGAPALFWSAVVATLVGHFAHSNLSWRVGPLKYLVNSPEMHIWHHTHPDAGPLDRNFGITLAVWDWLFGTAYLPPRRDPARLGFARIESYPANILSQAFAPFRRH